MGGGWLWVGVGGGILPKISVQLRPQAEQHGGDLGENHFIPFFDLISIILLFSLKIA